MEYYIAVVKYYIFIFAKQKQTSHLSGTENLNALFICRTVDVNWKQYCSGHPLARMLIPEPRHSQHVTVLVFVRWPCNVCAW